MGGPKGQGFAVSITGLGGILPSAFGGRRGLCLIDTARFKIS